MSNETRADSSLIEKFKPLLIGTVFVMMVLITLDQARAQVAERTGKEVVQATCAACHGAGANGAPKIGDKKAWSKRAAKGLSSLTKTAVEGIRKMPPHGANMTLTDTELKRAVAYMVNQSGGHWIEPISKTAPPVARSGEQIVQMRCVKCHESGVNGAPRIGDRAAWIPRLSRGLDVTVRSAINGHGAMPPRGGMADLTDYELRSAIIYMFNKGTVPVK